MYHATKSKGKRGYKGSNRKEYIRAEHLKVKSWKNIKIWAVRQYEKGMPVKDIKLMLGVSRTAIYDWIGLYTAFGKEIFRDFLLFSGLRQEGFKPRKLSRSCR